MDAATFERELLRLIFETDVVLERGQVAYHLGVTLDEAEKQLDALATRGVLTLESDDAGNLYYAYPNRPSPRRPAGVLPPHAASPLAADAHAELTARVASAADIASRAAAAAHIAVTAMINAEHGPQRPVPFHDGMEPITAPVVAVASALPGGGHFARRRVVRGLLWMGAIVAGYAVFWPVGIVVHVASGVDATMNFGKS